MNEYNGVNWLACGHADAGIPGCALCTTDVFYTPRGLTAYPSADDLEIANRAKHRPAVKSPAERLVSQHVVLTSMLDAERADRFSYGPSLTTMVDYVTADVHKQTVEQAFAVRL